MFDRFTDRARRVMGIARQEAQRFSHQYISTEHLLMGIVLEGDGVGAHVLQEFDVFPQMIKEAIEKISQPGPTMITMGQLPFTPRAKRVLELTASEARRLQHNYIGTEHLLLGLISEKEGMAAEVLMSLGLTLEGIREKTLEMLGVCIETDAPERQEQEMLSDIADYQSLVETEAPAFFDRYQEFTRTTACYPGCDKKGFESVAYCTFGLTGEAGEVAEKMKKRFRLGGSNAFLPGSVVTYEKTGKTENYEEFVRSVEKELGDVLWYVAGLASELGLTLSKVAKTNVEKLTSRKQRGVLKGEGDDR